MVANNTQSAAKLMEGFYRRWDDSEARKHVNRLCVAAGVPAIESGTAGYLGQVQVIRKVV